MLLPIYARSASGVIIGGIGIGISALAPDEDHVIAEAMAAIFASL